MEWLKHGAVGISRVEQARKILLNDDIRFSHWLDVDEPVYMVKDKYPVGLDIKSGSSNCWCPDKVYNKASKCKHEIAAEILAYNGVFK